MVQTDKWRARLSQKSNGIKKIIQSAKFIFFSFNSEVYSIFPINKDKARTFTKIGGGRGNGQAVSKPLCSLLNEWEQIAGF